MFRISIETLNNKNLELPDDVMKFLELNEGDQVMLMCRDDELVITNPKREAIEQIKEVEKIAHELGAKFAEETAYKYSGFFEELEIDENIKDE